MICQTFIPSINMKDTYWEDFARDLLKAILFIMLEDSDTCLMITEDKFSFSTSTVLNIFDTFTDSGDNFDSNYEMAYFSERHIKTSKVHTLATKCILKQETVTRRCVSSNFREIKSCQVFIYLTAFLKACELHRFLFQLQLKGLLSEECPVVCKLLT